MGRHKDITVKARRTTHPSYRLNTRAWTVLKGKHRNYCAAHHLPCARCRNPIDYSLPPQHRMAYETGHIISRKERPDLMYVWANLQPEHVKCNRSAQANPVVPQQDWVRPKF